jgi:Ni/Co efflux regulator RcnB
MRITSHHITRSIIIAFAVSAVLAPMAAAQQDLRMPDTREAAEQAERRQDLRMPDTREAAEQAERPQDLRTPDTRDWAAGRGPDKAPVIEFVEVQKPSGFDWTAAGLGAAAGIGLVLIGAGTALTAARFRRRAVGTARV